MARCGNGRRGGDVFAGRQAAYESFGIAKRLRRGAAAVETAICLPFLFLLCYGVWGSGPTRPRRSGRREFGAGRVPAGLDGSLFQFESGEPGDDQHRLQFRRPELPGPVAPSSTTSPIPACPITGNGVFVTVTNETRNLTCKVQGSRDVRPRYAGADPS